MRLERRRSEKMKTTFIMADVRVPYDKVEITSFLLAMKSNVCI